MSAGETDGYDLTVETLEFIDSNWATAVGNVGQSYDKPVLRNDVEKTLYNTDETAGYSAQLRNNDVVTVGKATRTDEPLGTNFDFDTQREVDVTVEAMPGNGFSVIESSEDWARFVIAVREAILIDRVRPITGQDCRFDWRWLTIANEAVLPATENNRNLLGVELTVVWHGFESLP